MSVTVKVIFLGLIGFVPSPEGQDDMAALLVNPTQAEKSYPAECPTPEHISMVALLHGRCDSAPDVCYRITDELRVQAIRMGLGGFLNQFPQLLNSEKEALGHVNEPYGLVWFLNEEDLNLVGDEEEDLDIRNTLAALVVGTAPKSAGQSSYFSWVPSMKKLTGGQGEVKADCLHANKRCPLHARFLIEGGDVGACHMYHDASNSPGVERDVRIFEYLIPGKRFIEQRAVADAVQVEFHQKDHWIDLKSEKLPERTPQQRVEARLRPDDQGRLTLVVANLPPCPTNANPAALSRHGCHHAHSDVLFQLLENDRVPRPIRVMNEERRRVDPGPCEEEMEQFENPFASTCLLEYPHSITACDGTRFPKPGF